MEYYTARVLTHVNLCFLCIHFHGIFMQLKRNDLYLREDMFGNLFIIRVKKILLRNAIYVLASTLLIVLECAMQVVFMEKQVWQISHHSIISWVTFTRIRPVSSFCIRPRFCSLSCPT